MISKNFRFAQSWIDAITIGENSENCNEIINECLITTIKPEFCNIPKQEGYFYRDNFSKNLHQSYVSFNSLGKAIILSIRRCESLENKMSSLITPNYIVLIISSTGIEQKYVIENIYCPSPVEALSLCNIDYNCDIGFKQLDTTLSVKSLLRYEKQCMQDDLTIPVFYQTLDIDENQKPLDTNRITKNLGIFLEMLKTELNETPEYDNTDDTEKKEINNCVKSFYVDYQDRKITFDVFPIETSAESKSLNIDIRTHTINKTIVIIFQEDNEHFITENMAYFKSKTICLIKVMEYKVNEKALYQVLFIHNNINSKAINPEITGFGIYKTGSELRELLLTKWILISKNQRICSLNNRQYKMAKEEELNIFAKNLLNNTESLLTVAKQNHGDSSISRKGSKYKLLLKKRKSKTLDKSLKGIQ